MSDEIFNTMVWSPTRLINTTLVLLSLLCCLVSLKSLKVISEKLSSGQEHFQLLPLQWHRSNFRFKDNCVQTVDSLKTGSLSSFPAAVRRKWSCISGFGTQKMEDYKWNYLCAPWTVQEVNPGGSGTIFSRHRVCEGISGRMKGSNKLVERICVQKQETQTVVKYSEVTAQESVQGSNLSSGCGATHCPLCSSSVWLLTPRGEWLHSTFLYVGAVWSCWLIQLGPASRPRLGSTSRWRDGLTLEHPPPSRDALPVWVQSDWHTDGHTDRIDGWKKGWWTDG